MTPAAYNADQAKTHGIAASAIGANSWADVVAVARWQSAHGLKNDGLFGPASVAAYRAEHPVAPPTGRLRRIGAWTTRAGVLSGSRTLLARAVDVGLTDVCLMINSSDDPHARPFASVATVVDVCLAYRAAGIAPWLATWARPSTDYMDRAADSLAAVAAQVQIAGVHVDAEEPWLAGSVGHRVAAERFAARMTALGLPWSVTGIVSTDMAEEGQLVRLAHAGIPQCYSTRKAWLKWQAKPGDLQRSGHKRWTPFGVPVEMGLACWDQTGAGGLTAEKAMQTALDATAALGVTTAWYWSLETLQGTAAAVVRDACALARASK